MNSVFDWLRVRLLLMSHLVAFARSSLRRDSISSTLSLANVKCVSSAYIRDWTWTRQLGKSLMYIKNNRGPKIVPCGIIQSR